MYIFDQPGSIEHSGQLDEPEQPGQPEPQIEQPGKSEQFNGRTERPNRVIGKCSCYYFHIKVFISY